MKDLNQVLRNKADRRDFFIKATDHLKIFHGISYGKQANKIAANCKTMTVPRMKNIRSEKGGTVHPSEAEVQILLDVYGPQLDQFVSDYFEPSFEEKQMEEMAKRLDTLEELIFAQRPAFLDALRAREEEIKKLKKQVEDLKNKKDDAQRNSSPKRKGGPPE